jgi:hypothetical protein
MISNWLRVGKDWRVASEIILPVPAAPAQRASRGTPQLLYGTDRLALGSVFTQPAD